MMSLLMRLFGKKIVHKTVARHVEGGPLDIRFGFALMRDRRVSVMSKLAALLAGGAVVAALVAMEVPVEALLGALLPLFAVPIEMMVDGAETIIGPLVMAALLLPHMAPRETVETIRMERAGLSAGPVIDAEFVETRSPRVRFGASR